MNQNTLNRVLSALTFLEHAEAMSQSSLGFPLVRLQGAVEEAVSEIRNALCEVTLEEPEARIMNDEFAVALAELEQPGAKNADTGRERAHYGKANGETVD